MTESIDGKVGEHGPVNVTDKGNCYEIVLPREQLTVQISKSMLREPFKSEVLPGLSEQITQADWAEYAKDFDPATFYRDMWNTMADAITESMHQSDPNAN
ncbi:hypothetical protein HY642_02725 [Candidatus Woesearchaeota archaeon]|nr:hypothetical protein [Candidatus Woesearchaeota archaeon]